ncbi:MAG: hypothetical protein DHS20C15_23170 [Planctomycetota bacterium]|nr:MAG: hypothetical protein DHS20C15_23170 [Planctomycetota bacterium]
MPSLIAALLLCTGCFAPLAGGAAALDDELDAAITQRGRVFVAKFHAGQHEALWQSFSPQMRAAMSDDPTTLAAFKLQVDAQLGFEDELVSEVVFLRGPLRTYVRTATHEKADGNFVTTFMFTPDGEITSFTIQPERVPAPSDYLDYETKTPLSLPFDGVWTIVWGGRTIQQNYHAFTRDQRFAYDILVTREGATHEGDGTELEQFYAWGRRVLAPGDGVVVRARDGIVDNVPGEMNPSQALGNHVILDHGNGEFSFLAHFKQDTLVVAEGDEVKAGDLLGLCGNSGNTTEPHIHYHLQDTPRFGAGQGMPAAFLNYRADGEVVERGEPVQLQIVARNEP